MHIVYILQSKSDPKRFYKGYTTNLQERLINHNLGKSKHTSKYRPWGIVFYCVFPNKKRAMKFEHYLKSASGIAFMRKRLISYQPVT
ncbi:MAG: GIY-YIG nuclease family protein [Patescibacteria group bacterium]